MKSPEDDLGLSGKVALRYRTTINDHAAAPPGVVGRAADAAVTGSGRGNAAHKAVITERTHQLRCYTRRRCSLSNSTSTDNRGESRRALGRCIPEEWTGKSWWSC